MTDIAVVGAGPAGLAAALALRRAGASVSLIGRPPSPAVDQRLDTRTAALLTSSIDMLKALNVWEAIRPQAAPLKAIRIVDATGGPWRAPDVEFKASELGLEAFGYNIANTSLMAALYAEAASVVNDLHPSEVIGIDISHDRALLRLAEGRAVDARLVAGADGRHSICRKQAGIGATERPTTKAAIATSFAHAAPHLGVSNELHREGGSLTTVPLPEPCASALIVLGEATEIDRLMRLDDAGFGAVLDERLGGLLGRVGEVGARASFPVVTLAADRLAFRRTALVGEAGHVLPPIGAQGLNLGLRDAAALADCVGAACAQGSDPGGDDVLSAYDRARKLDVLSRSVGIDLLSRSLLSGFFPLQAARGLVSHGLNALPSLRRLVMRIGMAPPTELPSLMRPVHRPSAANPT